MDLIGKNWDFLVFLGLTAFHIFSWRQYRANPAIETDVTKRQFAASAMSSTVTAGLTAVSILIPASLLVIELGRGNESQTLPASALDEVFRGIGWLLISLLLGLVLLYLLPMRAQKFDVGKDFPIGVLFAPQLLALILGVLRVVLGIQIAIYG